MNAYSFESSYDVSQIAIEKVSDYLLTLSGTLDIINVEGDKAFQEFDIDMIHVTNDSVVNIEVKADTYKSKYFFFETVSNATKGTPGCFMYTRADYLYYYFTQTDALYILPMQEARDWFIDNMDRFTKKELSTTGDNKVLYNTYGYTVPIRTVLKEVKGARLIRL